MAQTEEKRRKEIQRLINQITKACQELDSVAPIHQLLVFLKVAAADQYIGLPTESLINDEDMDLGKSGVSRNLLELGSTSWKKSGDEFREGYGLLRQDVDPTDRRRRILYLTTKGKRLVERLTK